MTRPPPTLDMLPDGTFRTPQRAGVPLSFKLMLGAIAVAAVAGALAMAALALWIFSMVLPVLVVAAGAAWVMLKFRRWQATRRGPGTLRPF